jgi:hypothetical protein
MICSGAAGLPANAAPGVPTATSAYSAWPLWNRIATSRSTKRGVSASVSSEPRPHVEHDGIEPVGLGEGLRLGQGGGRAYHLRDRPLQSELEVESQQEFVLDNEDPSHLQ